jgi:hypothetical protein
VFTFHEEKGRLTSLSYCAKMKAFLDVHKGSDHMHCKIKKDYRKDDSRFLPELESNECVEPNVLSQEQTSSAVV